MSTTEYVLIQNVVTSRWTRLAGRILAVVIVIYGLWLAFKAYVGVRTNELWFRSVHASQVYDTRLKAQILLFVVFGGLMTLAVGAALYFVTRSGPRSKPDSGDQPWRYLFNVLEPHLRKWAIAVIALKLGIGAGGRATNRWQTYLLWRHSVSWHQQDPQFHRDISYFVEVLPFHKMVVSNLSSTAWTALLVTLVVSFVYGGLQISRTGVAMTKQFKVQVSLLLGLWLLFKAPSYWLSRYSLSMSNHGPVTGLSYTDIHARLPAYTILMLVAILCAFLLFANARVRRLRLAVVGLGVMLVATQLVGNAWPSLISHYREKPSVSSLDKGTIERNLAATKVAFGLGEVTTEQYAATQPLSTADLEAQAARGAQVRLLDPNQLSPTFNVKQQIQAYYLFKSTLDIDNYPVDGTQQDVAIAARELNLGGISRNSWTNRHLVYTHGYGVVAAPTDQFGAQTGTPIFINGGVPPTNKIPVDQPGIYFGQYTPGYSIVGQPAGSKTNLEFDYPSTTGSTAAAHTTYTGDGGVPIGSRLDRLLYAFKLHDPNIFFSSQINSGSQLLTVRNPRARVAQVAPWLTLDGDVYPAVVDGHVEWVVDGYTSTANYPDAQRINLRQATSNTITNSGAISSQPSTAVNYLHNSVKAVVDAYTGKVTLYSWNQDTDPDPLLQAWEGVYPGLVQPESSIPADLLPHLRYPQDLFNVQRSLLVNYHVTDESDFYNGSGFWKVPTDPTLAATNSLNSGSAGPGSSPTMASTYMSLSPTGDGDARYALSSPLVTLNYRDLAGFVSVDATPGPDYGKFTLLEVPTGQSVESPAQIQNDIESDNEIAKALTLERGGNSRVVLGNLLTIPLDGKFLYVEPVYTQAQGNNSFPILRHVVAVYGNGQPAFEPTLDAALQQAFANDASSDPAQ